jgi:hypothetical protein
MSHWSLTWMPQCSSAAHGKPLPPGPRASGTRGQGHGLKGQGPGATAPGWCGGALRVWAVWLHGCMGCSSQPGAARGGCARRSTCWGPRVAGSARSASWRGALRAQMTALRGACTSGAWPWPRAFLFCNPGCCMGALPRGLGLQLGGCITGSVVFLVPVGITPLLPALLSRLKSLQLLGLPLWLTLPACLGRWCSQRWTYDAQDK